MPADGPEPDYGDIARRLARLTKDALDLIQTCLPAEKPAELPAFLPNAFQQAILAALDRVALRTDALAQKVGSRSRLFVDPGGLPELQEEGLVAHHKRIGFYRPDSPPPGLAELMR